MKQQIIRIFANALVGALASAVSVWLGANATEAIATGSAGSATLGDFATDVVNATIGTVRTALA